MINKFLIVVFLFFSISVFAQSKIVGEELKLVFSEYFVDPSDNFPKTGKSDAKFWATYGDGYYYVEHKVNSYTAILAKQPKSKLDFAIKCKLMLGPSDNNTQSVGVLFSMTNGGKNALVFEFNRKKQFRVRDLQGNVISDSWVKSKFLKPAEIYQKIEIKCFNQFYEIFVNDKQIFSFTDERFEGGRYGIIVGPLSLAKMDYFNVYDLTIPGRPATVPTKKLLEKIDSLEKQNEVIRKELIEKKYNTKDVAVVDVLNTLEKRIEILLNENKELKSIVDECENNPTSEISGEIKSDKLIDDSELMLVKSERDDLKRKLEEYSLSIENLKNEIESNKQTSSLTGISKKSTESNALENNSLINSDIENKVIEKQEKYFPSIDELKIPVKKSSVKL